MFLIRHDDVGATGICYGQTDLEAVIAYEKTAQKIKAQLPENPGLVFTSPLKRCAKLATACFGDKPIQLRDNLKEVHFGDWEETPWDHIDRAIIEQWAQQPTRFAFPNGETLLDFEQRVSEAFEELRQFPEDTCVFTHGGVIRLMRALAKNQPWEKQLQQPVAFASVTMLKGG